MEGVRYCCPMFGVSRQIFIEALNIKIHENASGGSQAHICGREGGHDEAIVTLRYKYKSA